MPHPPAGEMARPKGENTVSRGGKRCVPKEKQRLAGLLVVHVVSTPAAVLLELDALAGVHLGLRGDVVSALALLTLQGDLHSLVGRHLGLALALSTTPIGAVPTDPPKRASHMTLVLGIGQKLGPISVATDRFELSTSRL